ncbi:WG repeat-containing protein [uncultured Pseudoflavonifractor sp.]|uniref:S-layer homology domain-containing protein n=1 Tax=uncultured Pseudoflavonifractor sp. TaxID=1221379 RepID=UPI00260158D2|nr:WG repeat-containing protein [uncultured Pseudoflavonifractor sp.]
MKRTIRKLPLLLVLTLALSLTSPAALGLEVRGNYTEGMAAATDGSAWGYVNASGTVAIPIRFEEASDFSLGVARAKEDGKYGLLRQDGLWLLEPLYDSLTAVDCGVYIARRDGVWELLTVVPVPGADGASHQLYTGASSIAVEQGAAGNEIVISWTDKDSARISLSSLPRTLSSLGVPFAAFSLRSGRTAAFSDVSGKDWFDLWVDLAYNLGLMEGPGDGTFMPYSTLTVGEALKMAAVLDSAYAGRPFTSGGDPWYANAVNYCLTYGIITDATFDSYTRPITRAELALVFSATSPVQEADDINDAGRVASSIPDVAGGDFAASSIYALYAKGIVSGSDKQLTFRPEAVITRSEVAAMAARIARPEQRILLWPANNSSTYYHAAGIQLAASTFS